MIDPLNHNVQVDGNFEMYCTYQCKSRTGGGVRSRGGDLTNFNIFYQIPQGWKQKVNQKMSKKPYPRGKNQNKQYYNTI